MIAVVDFIENMVKKTSEAVQATIGKEVFCQYGHIGEINNTLTSYSKTTEFSEKKYPAIFLLQDFPEDKGKDSEIELQTKLQLLIVAESNKDYRSKDRYVNVIKPILYPIYEEFFNQLNKSDMLLKSYNGFPHTQIDRPLVSDALVETTKGKANLFNDHLDAVEIRNLELTFLKNC